MPLTADFRHTIGQSADRGDTTTRMSAHNEQLIHRLPNLAARVGTCPDCGYPSLDSLSCAFCRNHAL